MNLKKRPARWVPHFLSDAQKRVRLDACRRLLRSSRQANFFSRIVTGDESWCLAYDPASKAATMTWLHPREQRPEKPRVERNAVKVMILIFWDVNGVVHREFIRDGHGVDGPFYLGVMRRLREAIRRKRFDRWRNRDWLLQHNNAPAHRARIVTQFLENTQTNVIEHPPYSPDLAPSDYWLFNRLKTQMCGEIFATADEICQRVNNVLCTIPAADFRAAMFRLRDRWQKCIQAGGSYFE